MGGNTIGECFRLTTFGESHGKSIGGIIDGCPAGFRVNLSKIQLSLDRRKPGQSSITSQRKELDEVEFLSGIYDGLTLGTPISFQIHNTDSKSKDYDHLKDTYRPSHADFVYQEKYGHRDHRGGGRASARETSCRVVAGSIAEQLLAQMGVSIFSYVQAVGEISLDTPYQQLDFKQVFENIVRCPDKKMAEKMISYIEKIKKEGDTVGGIIQTVVNGCPPGIGEPVFDKLHADLAKSMLSINAVKGFEYGSGFKAAQMKGSEHNDSFVVKDNKIRTNTNWSGGIQGGISNGEAIYFRVAFKPVATIMRDQDSVTSSAENTVVKGKGRHDPCVVPRAVPIVTAMTAITIFDHILRNKTAKVENL